MQREQTYHPLAYSESSFNFRFTEKGPTGKLTLATLVRYLLEAADQHADNLEVDFNTMFQRGLTWAILRVAMEVPDHLSSLAELKVKTWPAQREGMFIYRDYAMLDTTNTVLSQATSQWVLLEKQTHKPVKPPEFIDTLYEKLYGNCPPKRWNITFSRWNHYDMSGFPHSSTKKILVRRSDTDINGHTNTASYAEFIEESIPLELYHRQQVRFLELQCMTETFEGEKLTSLSQFREDYSEGVHTLTRTSDGAIIAKAKTLWK